MKIKVDKEGKQAIMELCDTALKAYGNKWLNGVNIILNAIEDIKEEKEGKEDE